MDFFNKLGGSIQNVGKEVSKKTKDLGGTLSLNSQIKENEARLVRIYQAIGENYCSSYAEEARSRYGEEFSQIDAIREAIENDKVQLRVLKGLKLCPNCGAEVENAALHCPMCGTELEVPVVADTPAQDAKPSPAFCPNCGSPLNPGTNFCGKCGSKVG